MPMKTPKKNGLEFYKQGKQFRWRIRKQGRIIDASTQGYSRLTQGAARNYLSSRGYTAKAQQEISKALANYKNKKK